MSELPGCRTYERIYEEAITQAEDAIDGWIYGHRSGGYPVPPPRVYLAGCPTVSNSSH